MDFLKILLTISPVATGMMSAWYWYRSSEVEFKSTEGEPFLALENKVREQGVLNKSAAGWAVATAGLEALRTLVD